MPQPLAPSATPLKVLALDARDLDPQEFAGTHGDGFFVLVSSPFPTKFSWERNQPTRPHMVDPDTGEIAIGVFSLRKRTESTHPFISIGRSDDNDISIHDETVSRFHAFVRWEPPTPTVAAQSSGAGRWFLQDARSRNGTTVDGARVPRRGEGDAVELRPGTIVAFGSVSLHFADATELLNVARLFA